MRDTMQNINQILRQLTKRGFRIENANGSLVKLYPSDNNLPFYSLHLGERAIHPLKRFAKKQWKLDLTKL